MNDEKTMVEMKEILEMVRAAQHLIGLYTHFLEQTLKERKEEEKFQNDEELMRSTTEQENFEWGFASDNV